MIAKKPKFKLSNDAYTKILNLIETLPPLQLLGKDGKPLARTVTKFTGIVIQNGKKYKQHQTGTEPILVNHKMRLIEAFETNGYDGINNYVKWANQFVEKSEVLVDEKTH
jgi:hypothetical protein